LTGDKIPKTRKIADDGSGMIRPSEPHYTKNRETIQLNLSSEDNPLAAMMGVKSSPRTVEETRKFPALIELLKVGGAWKNDKRAFL